MRSGGWVVVAGLSAVACGYAPIYGRPQTDRFAVVLASSEIADAVAADEVVAGVRDELAKLGAYAPGADYPRCEVEVLRSDETSQAIGVGLNGEGTLLPDTRATEVAVVGRAWCVRGEHAPRERDTGDVRASRLVGTTEEARAAVLRSVDAVRAAARRAGRAIGRRLIGLPAPSDEG